MQDVIIYAFDNDYSFLKELKSLILIEEEIKMEDYLLLKINQSFDEVLEIWTSLLVDLDKHLVVFLAGQKFNLNVFNDYIQKLMPTLEVGVYTAAQLAMRLVRLQRGPFIRAFLKKYVDDTQFVRVLEHYFDSDLNVSESASKLYMHRNTLLYRINAFKERTGFNLHSFKDSALLYNYLIGK